MSDKGRGWNLCAGQEDGDRGRVLGGQVRAESYNGQPAPADCEYCRRLGYTTLAQHNGHLGFRAILDHRPTALSNLKAKIKRTGRPESRARWKEIGA